MVVSGCDTPGREKRRKDETEGGVTPDNFADSLKRAKGGVGMRWVGWWRGLVPERTLLSFPTGRTATVAVKVIDGRARRADLRASEE